MSIQKNLCQFVLYLVRNCINLCQFGEGFFLVIGITDKIRRAEKPLLDIRRAITSNLDRDNIVRQQIQTLVVYYMDKKLYT
jgi:hypothetical protein